MKAQQYKVMIFGDQYSLLSDESQEHMNIAASLVDNLMKEIAGKATSADTKKIAILTALQIASKLLKAETALQNDTQKAQQLLEFVQDEYRSIVDTL